ncbi:hypothetical protein TanjilG_25416 [Lupinus angustifolius]|uniref:Uncharacterized protein n=1 Tax=Lupinus angustifolius TaxID=3871 RepID=A0A1J7GHH2_LUPAN|nr:hypothetical protein TanjilG_25416 [Lupinus angustifolius]
MVPNDAIKPEMKKKVVSGLHHCCLRMANAALAIDDALRRCRWRKIEEKDMKIRD